MSNDVKEEILQLRLIQGCPNMFSIEEVLRFAFDNDFYSAVTWINENRKAYSNFILTGKTEYES